MQCVFFILKDLKQGQHEGPKNFDDDDDNDDKKDDYDDKNNDDDNIYDDYKGCFQASVNFFFFVYGKSRLADSETGPQALITSLLTILL